MKKNNIQKAIDFLIISGLIKNYTTAYKEQGDKKINVNLKDIDRNSIDIPHFII